VKGAEDRQSPTAQPSSDHHRLRRTRRERTDSPLFSRPLLVGARRAPDGQPAQLHVRTGRQPHGESAPQDSPEASLTCDASSITSPTPRRARAARELRASAFFVLLASGLVLYLPSIWAAVARRALIKDIHFWTGISWAGAILLISLLGNRRAVAQTIREVDLFDRDDRRFLTGDTHVPQGRFNAGLSRRPLTRDQSGAGALPKPNWISA
jgi:hypothetical protein